MEPEDTFDDVPDFSEVELIRVAVERTLAMLAAHRRGQLVLWVALEMEGGIGRESSHWSAYWHRLRRDFRRTTGIVLMVRKGVGVKLLTVEEQIGMRSRKRAKKAARQLFMDVLELEAIPDSEMDDRQRQERAMRVRLARTHRNDVLRGSRFEGVVLRPTPNHMPRVRPPSPPPPVA